MPLIKYDAGLSKLIDGEIERIAGGLQFTEGPVWHRDGYLLFSDIPANTIWFWTHEGTKTYRKPSGNSNGLVFDRQGRLIACEHGTRRVSRTERDWSVITLAERFEGKRLNSPNDVVVRSDGTIYFTDPPYGVDAKDRELDFQGVYRLSPTGEIAVEVRDFDKPNGLAFSLDERTLYIDDSARRHVRRFQVDPSGKLSGGEVCVKMPSPEMGSPDGMKLDCDGRLYVTGPEGVWVFDTNGQRLGIIATPEKPSNCCWGEGGRRTLFITARSSVYRLPMKVAGAET